MKHITLNTGGEMPMLGLGTYALRGTECERCVLDALELGYRLFDTAQMYGNEREVGNALRRGGVPRGELFVTTKLYRPSTSYALAKQGIEASLNALQLDFIDLLLIHEPYREAEEMYPALEEAYRAARSHRRFQFQCRPPRGVSPFLHGDSGGQSGRGPCILSAAGAS